VVLVPMALVMLQPDLGTALVFASILLASLFWAGTPLPTLFFLISPVIGLFLSISVWMWGAYIVLLALVLGFSTSRTSPRVSRSCWPTWSPAPSRCRSGTSWRRTRRTASSSSSTRRIDPRGAGYNLIQSRVAIGSGGGLGEGLHEGTQKRLAFLPEQHTDFIFAVIGEEWGFIGVALGAVAFGLIFWRLVRIAERSSDPFASLVPSGSSAAGSRTCW
jgi:rod shape determining protein RodA